MSHFYKFDLKGSGLLPQNWSSDILALSLAASELIILDGKHPTSMDTRGDVLQSFVVPGRKIKKDSFWLFLLYNDFFRKLVSVCYGEQYVIGNDLDSSLSVSSIRGIGARYELHVDSNPVTCLLFVSDLKHEDGGQICLHLPDRIEVVEARAGTLLIFKGSEIPHEVLPLKGDFIRLSVPMNFYPKGVEQKIWTDK